MANKILTKKSSTASVVPTAADLDVGELAVNTADAKLYTKHTDDSIVEVVGSGGTGGTTNLTAGVIWDNHDSSRPEYNEALEVLADGTYVVDHTAYPDSEELRSVYIEKFVPADAGLEAVSVTPTITGALSHSTVVTNNNSSSVDLTGGGYLTFPSVTLTNTFSIDMWINMPAAPASLDGLLNYGYYTGGVNGFILYIYPSRVVTFFQSQGTTYQYEEAGDALALNTWHHIRVSKQPNSGAGEYYIFINGVLEATIAATADIANQHSLIFGARNGSYKFPGYIDSLRVDNVARITAFTPQSSSRAPSAEPLFQYEDEAANSTFSAYYYTATGTPVPAYWQLESFDDWGVQFTSPTTTTLVNNTTADAVIRARITKPTAVAVSTGDTNLTAGVIWDNHALGRDEYNESLTVLADATEVLTHTSDSEELRSVYIEKFVEVPGEHPVLFSVSSDVMSNLTFSGSSALGAHTLANSIGGGGASYLIHSSAANAEEFIATSQSGQLMKISGINFQITNPNGNITNSFEVLTSNDGATWSQIYSYTESTSGSLDVINVVLDVVASHLKVKQLSPANDWSRIHYPTSGVLVDIDIVDSTPTVGSTYWQLETYNDWGVQFTSPTTTTLINNTTADAVIRARITKPTSVSTNAYGALELTADGAVISPTAGIAVTDGTTKAITHTADASNLRSVYIEKYVDATAESDKTVTANGNVNHSTALGGGKFGASSIYFDGADNFLSSSEAGDYLEIAPTTDFQFGGDDFTVEFWLKLSDTSIQWNTLVFFGDPESFLIGYHSAFGVGVKWNGVDANTDAPITNNDWHHLAVVRSGTDALVFLDGVQILLTAIGNVVLNSSTTVKFGKNASGWLYDYKGYMDEIRISNTARYTANFTPSTTTFSPDASTVLLIHSDDTNGSTIFTDTVTPAPAYWQLETYNDWGVQFTDPETTTITNNTGSDATARFRITAPTAAASSSTSSGGSSIGTLIDDEKLFTHLVPETYTHTDDTAEMRSVYIEKQIAGSSVATTISKEVITTVPGKTITAAGNIQHSTSNSKFGSSSMDFTNGTSYLDVAAHSDLNFAANASFTLELWVKCDSTSGTNLNNRIFQKGANQLDGYGVFIDTTDVFFGRTDEKLLTFSRSLLVGTGNWHHVAVVRDTATIELYLDGFLKSNGTNGDALDGNDILSIGRYPGLTDNRFNGYIDEFRISNTARYTDAFTPSTVPFDYDTNTLLLIHSDDTDGSTTFIDTITTTTALTTAGETILDDAIDLTAVYSLTQTALDATNATTAFSFDYLASDPSSATWTAFSDNHSSTGTGSLTVPANSTQGKMKVNITPVTAPALADGDVTWGQTGGMSGVNDAQSGMATIVMTDTYGLSGPGVVGVLRLYGGSVSGGASIVTVTVPYLSKITMDQLFNDAGASNERVISTVVAAEALGGVNNGIPMIWTLTNGIPSLSLYAGTNEFYFPWVSGTSGMIFNGSTTIVVDPTAVVGSFSSIDFTKNSAPYWELDTFEDWGVEFESGTTTKVTNRTGDDATARIRITAPTAAASGSGGGATTLSELTDSTTATTDPLITSNLTVGHFWINSTSGEAYVCTDATTNENVWTNIGEGSGRVPVGIIATGGTVTTDATYKYHAFTSSGDFVVTSEGLVDYLVVGGGGGGANLFGGGGGGGVLTSTYPYVTAQTYSIVIGAGGFGGTSSAGTPYNGANGGDSSFATFTALGGGGGGANSVGANGASGGGGGDWAAAGFAGGSGTSGQGHAGGSASGVDAGGGAGGGATAVGGNGTSSAAGSGGAGLTSSISGSSVTYAAGGNGGSVLTSANGVDASSNTGGGGGGGSRTPNNSASGGNGGSGIVILRYTL